MLNSLITSRTRLKILLRFFSNSESKSYLRGLATEFGESTNSVRYELNNLSKAGYLTSKENGRTIEYRANTSHPLYPELSSVVHKYLGFDRIIETLVKKLGDVQYAFVAGDYALGKDTGTIEVKIIGEVNRDIMSKLASKAEKLIKRKISTEILSEKYFKSNSEEFEEKNCICLWKSEG